MFELKIIDKMGKYITNNSFVDYENTNLASHVHRPSSNDLSSHADTLPHFLMPSSKDVLNPQPPRASSILNSFLWEKWNHMMLWHWLHVLWKAGCMPIIHSYSCEFAFAERDMSVLTGTLIHSPHPTNLKENPKLYFFYPTGPKFGHYHKFKFQYRWG